ncbi:MAG: FAD-dependent oxidoreductase, partial [Salinisphaeraceae bacterium]|nr:FAD-dependent oxidoreductase [Salinisphaeraceae bacterium]
LLFENGDVTGVRVQELESGESLNLKARLVINAAGAWCDRLRMQVGGDARLRPLRGSHLVFDYADLPCAEAVAFFHPDDRRAVFLVPWDGRVLLGTTDIDHSADLDTEPRCTAEEAEYLLRGVNFLFPGLNLNREQAVASYAGVRPVVSSGQQVNPSSESREHALWQEKGLLSITGGKLTTFRKTAFEVLDAVRKQWPQMPALDHAAPALAPVNAPSYHPKLSGGALKRLYARYGQVADEMLAHCPPEQFERIENTDYLWAELVWAAQHEAVVHLQDLLLRRTRLGFILRDGGVSLLPTIAELCQAHLGWDDARWKLEAKAYALQWQANYAPIPAAESRAATEHEVEHE